MKEMRVVVPNKRKQPERKQVQMEKVKGSRMQGQLEKGG